MTQILKLELKIGLFLLGLFLFQAALNLHIPGLSSYQKNDLFRYITGTIFLGYIAYQWKLTKTKTQAEKPNGQILRLTLQNHKFWGLLGPMFFYLHTPKMGYSYLFFLSCSFFSVYLLGLFHERLVRFRKPLITQLSLIGHVGISTAMVALIAYHIFIVVYF
jgi:hypothetical protein